MRLGLVGASLRARQKQLKSAVGADQQHCTARDHHARGSLTVLSSHVASDSDSKSHIGYDGRQPQDKEGSGTCDDETLGRAQRKTAQQPHMSRHTLYCSVLMNTSKSSFRVTTARTP